MFAIAVCALALPGTAAADYKCWTNRDGVRECGERVPPEYAQQGHETRNKQGIRIDQSGAAPDREELARLRAEEAAREAERARLERERRTQLVEDDTLLALYTTEADLLRRRDAHLEGLRSRLNHTGKVALANLQRKRYRLEEEAASFERSEREIPPELSTRLENNRGQIRQSESSLIAMSQELEDLISRYAKELKRFRELRSRARTGAN
ncbi:MAG: hypothetical protein ACR2RL_06365 [Gammaproteobacteria bacterium]